MVHTERLRQAAAATETTTPLSEVGRDTTEVIRDKYYKISIVTEAGSETIFSSTNMLYEINWPPNLLAFSITPIEVYHSPSPDDPQNSVPVKVEGAPKEYLVWAGIPTREEALHYYPGMHVDDLEDAFDEYRVVRTIGGGVYIQPPKPGSSSYLVDPETLGLE